MRSSVPAALPPLFSPRAWFASPAYPWVSGVVLTCGAMLEVVNWSSSAVVVGSTLVAVVPLMWRRARPGVAWISVTAAFVSFLAWSDLFAATAVSGLIGWYTLARNRLVHPLLLAVIGTVAAVLVNIAHVEAGVYGEHPPIGSEGSLGLFSEAFVVTVGAVGAISVGDAIRSREDTRRERAAARDRLIAMERRRAAEAERAAIARELHDIVSHSVSMIAVQAESATYSTPGLSPQARDGFQEIAASARSSMAELRQLLGVLRTDSADTVATAPQPTLDELDGLLKQHRAVGGEVELRISGERRRLAASWELSVYRIVQEALTNVRKHAHGARTVVELRYRPDRLQLRIADDGPGPRGTGGGHGLAGMRERAALLGGWLTAGMGSDGGFLVEAELPSGHQVQERETTS